MQFIELVVIVVVNSTFLKGHFKAQGTSLFGIAASGQKGCPEISSGVPFDCQREESEAYRPWLF